MLATLPIADEIMVFPSTVIRSGQDDLPYSIAFALPVSTKGLKFICRETFAEESQFDHPLAARFDEQDAVVVFDDVLVPWDRVFLLEDAERANEVSEATLQTREQRCKREPCEHTWVCAVRMHSRARGARFASEPTAGARKPHHTPPPPGVTHF